MCGICGFIGAQSEPQRILEDMKEVIRHRGPDGEGSFFKGEAALGFRRLAIVDVEHGHQPMQTRNGRFTVVFNGEIYNYPILRHELELAGHHFQTNCDTEVLLHGFEAYGKELVSKLRGMFAFAIWDAETETLFAARDFFGIKPFYYTVINQTLVFASEIKSILQFPHCPRVLHQEAFEQYLCFQYSPLAETFFQGIFKLLPGEQFTFRNGKLHVTRWGRPQPTPQEQDAPSADRLDKVLRQSIRVHHQSDVEIGTLLSSGVDSSLLAAQLRGNKTFTVGFLEDDSFYNESSYAAELSAALHKEHHRRTISGDDFFAAVPDVQYYMDEPLADPAAVALYFADELAAQHVKVVFSGEGADELFAGYNIYREPHDVRPMTCLPLPLRRWLGRLAARIPFRFKGKNFLIRGSQALEERYLGGANIFSVEERRRILKQSAARPPSAVTAPCWKQSKGLDDVARMQLIDQEFWLPGDILLKSDKMSMAHSLEARVPYLDREVYQTARKLPLSSRIQGKSTKHLFRQVAERLLPPSVARKKKLGFPVPIRVWLREETYYKQVRDLFTNETAAQFFQTDEILALLDAHFNGKADHSRKIWTIYCFLLWYRIYFEQPLPQRQSFRLSMLAVRPCPLQMHHRTHR